MFVQPVLLKDNCSMHNRAELMQVVYAGSTRIPKFFLYTTNNYIRSCGLVDSTDYDPV